MTLDAFASHFRNDVAVVSVRRLHYETTSIHSSGSSKQMSFEANLKKKRTTANYVPHSSRDTAIYLAYLRLHTIYFHFYFFQFVFYSLLSFILGFSLAISFGRFISLASLL